MKNRTLLVATLFASAFMFGVQPSFGDCLLVGLETNAQAAPASAPAQGGNLETVLGLLDRTAGSFKNIQTDFVWDQYNKVVDDHDLQSGTMYFRRNGPSVEMAADITKPDKKQVLFSEGRVRVFQPKIDQVTEYSAGKNKSDFESFLVLGFGGRGHDLQKSFDVKYAGVEEANGVSAYKLELTPKSQRVKDMFSTITLWIDKDRGVSVQQRFQERSGDYRLAKYNNIKLLDKLNNDVFKLKTTNSTKVIRPNG
jgi:outer membrane lipoprotein-sorting protein